MSFGPCNFDDPIESGAPWVLQAARWILRVQQVFKRFWPIMGITKHTAMVLKYLAMRFLKKIHVFIYILVVGVEFGYFHFCKSYLSLNTSKYQKLYELSRGNFIL